MADLESLLDRRRQLQHELVDLEVEIERQRATDNAQPSVGAILEIEEAAKRLNTTVDALYRKRKRLRLGYLDALDNTLKFTEAELDDYARRQRRG